MIQININHGLHLTHRYTIFFLLVCGGLQLSKVVGASRVYLPEDLGFFSISVEDFLELASAALAGEGVYTLDGAKPQLSFRCRAEGAIQVYAQDRTELKNLGVSYLEVPYAGRVVALTKYVFTLSFQNLYFDTRPDIHQDSSPPSKF